MESKLLRLVSLKSEDYGLASDIVSDARRSSRTTSAHVIVRTFVVLRFIEFTSLVVRLESYCSHTLNHCAWIPTKAGDDCGTDLVVFPDAVSSTSALLIALQHSLAQRMT